MNLRGHRKWLTIKFKVESTSNVIDSDSGNLRDSFGHNCIAKSDCNFVAKIKLVSKDFAFYGQITSEWKMKTHDYYNIVFTLLPTSAVQ